MADTKYLYEMMTNRMRQRCSQLILIITIILFVKCNNMNQIGYEIKPVDDLIEIRNKQNAQFVYQDEESLAHIYKLQDGRMILLPAIGKDGLVFESERNLKEVLSHGNIPLKEDDPNPFQIDRERIKNFESNIDYFLKMMSDTLDININVSNDDTLYYKEISKRIRDFGYEKAYNTLFIPIGIFVGEKIKKKTLSQWGLKKEYGYNPYYIPELTTSDRVYYPWYKLADMLLERKKFDLQTHITLASIGFEK